MTATVAKPKFIRTKTTGVFSFFKNLDTNNEESIQTTIYENKNPTERGGPRFGSCSSPW